MPADEASQVERSAHSLFKVLDTNIDGKITEEELKEVRLPRLVNTRYAYDSFARPHCVASLGLKRS